MDNHVTSLEMSKKLMDAEVMKISHFYYVFGRPSVNGRPPIMTRKEIDDLLPFSTEVEYIPAYLLSELLEMVKGEWGLWVNEGGFYCELQNSTAIPQSHKTPIEAVAEVILWQKEAK